MTRKPRKPVHHVEMTEGKCEIIRGMLEEYDIESAQDIQDALKDLLGGTIKEVWQAKTWPIRNWGKVRGELSVMYPERLPE